MEAFVLEASGVRLVQTDVLAHALQGAGDLPVQHQKRVQAFVMRAASRRKVLASAPFARLGSMWRRLGVSLANFVRWDFTRRSPHKMQKSTWLIGFKQQHCSQNARNVQ